MQDFGEDVFLRRGSGPEVLLDTEASLKRAQEAAKDVRMLVLDVDGTLTDGGLWYAPDGGVSKRFHVHDALGIKLFQAAGLEVCVVTGLASLAVEARVRELGVTEYHAGFIEKTAVLERVMERRGLSWPQLAYLGDDWVDAGPMSRVGLAAAVVDAQPEILALARWVSRFPGGQGAARELIRFILAAQGALDALWRRFAPGPLP